MEEGDKFKELANIDEYSNSYYKVFLKINGIIKFVPKSMQSIIKEKFDEMLQIKINQNIDGAFKLKEIEHFDESIDIFRSALYEANKISDTVLKEEFQSILMDYIDTTKMNKTKSIILDLSQDYDKLDVSDIAEKCGEGEEFIISLLQEMITNREISAEFIKCTKEIAFQKQINV